MIRAIATVCLSGTLIEKLTAISAAGFDCVEIFENDLLYFDGEPAEVARIAEDLGLRIVLFQPFRDFEAAPRDRWQQNLDRAERKFDTMEQLRTDLVLLCSSVAPDTIEDDAVAAEDLHKLGERAARRGLRVGYEALAWGKHVRTFGHAWKIVQAASHPAIGLILDSFHTLALDDDPAPIASIPGDRIFFVQFADAPNMRLDVLSWSRHFRCFPGQGALPVRQFARQVIASGYRGPWSLEIFNDEFRAAPARPTAVDGMRSLMLLEEELLAEGGTPNAPAAISAPPAAPACRGIEFIEFATDADTRARLVEQFDRMGFVRAGVHRSKDVSVHRQGDVNLILNAEDDSFSRSYFLVHGPSVCALALRVDNAQRALERAVAYRAQTFRGRVGPDELIIPAVRGLEGSLVYLVDRFGERGTIYDVDFDPVPPGQATASGDCGLLRIDHVAQTMSRSELDSALMFYRAVFGFEAETAHELIDPYGLIYSRVVQNADRSVRLPLNSTTSGRTSSARFLSAYSGAGVHHIAFATDDVFATVRCLRASGLPLLEIPTAYYRTLAANVALEPRRLDAMQQLSILYDRSGSGEFFHAYTRTFDGRFFFEFVQRENYDGFGAANAPVRLAAQALVDAGLNAVSAVGELAI